MWSCFCLPALLSCDLCCEEISACASRRNDWEMFFCSLPVCWRVFSLSFSQKLSLDLYYTEDEIYELSYTREPKNCKAPVSHQRRLLKWPFAPPDSFNGVFWELGKWFVGNVEKVFKRLQMVVDEASLAWPLLTSGTTESCCTQDGTNWDRDTIQTREYQQYSCPVWLGAT